ncbi:uncharacterized protein PGTG_10736 [Puccinia graminis f. sp. tritici CRL 75-36-700-3]|uniref:Uncharacterized protein n=1 Tax=Puccinia graminis f. sp. tritici (strain CRL 75-36-700-3 / race SCCL) TaxID=418459 RepID=E3KJV2_PUCGT|nr:uncharacterized protein PGTG_10736 [Puccinia graminis f. sp. tritici CRL 75-36-700-3]EFP84577.1 hypothetical protein PGTG_10736 [Puccinia graminis f. sp. tritici CRL 75-36-700-3]
MWPSSRVMVEEICGQMSFPEHVTGDRDWPGLRSNTSCEAFPSPGDFPSLFPSAIFDHPDRPYHLASQHPLARPKTAARRSYFQVPHMLWSSLYHLLCDWVKVRVFQSPQELLSWPVHRSDSINSQGVCSCKHSSRAHHQKSLSSLTGQPNESGRDGSFWDRLASFISD